LTGMMARIVVEPVALSRNAKFACLRSSPYHCFTAAGMPRI